jgi:hypothetical protein
MNIYAEGYGIVQVYDIDGMPEGFNMEVRVQPGEGGRLEIREVTIRSEVQITTTLMHKINWGQLTAVITSRHRAIQDGRV